MKKVNGLMFFVFTSLISTGQLPTVKNNKLIYPVIVNTDSGIIRGFLWHVSDSAVMLSLQKDLTAAGQPQQPISFLADNIQSFTVKKRKFNPLVPLAGAAIGFILGAGLASSDDDDGNANFFELLFSAIGGSSSDDRSRRRTALYIGCGMGFLGFTAGFFQGEKITVRLPLFARKKTLVEGRAKVENFIGNY